MTTDLTSCPYCNSTVPITPTAGVPGRMYCPRCGELFPYRSADGAEPDASAPLDYSNDAPRLAPALSPATRRSNRRIAFSVLAIMLVMALLALAVGLRTVPARRAHDPKEPLGYLPRDSNVLAGVRVAAALQEVAGRELLTQLRVANLNVSLINLEKWTGLSGEEMEAVVLGLRADDRFPPRFTLVIQTQRPYDEARLRSALRVTESVVQGRRILYRFPLGNTGLRGTVWYAADSILVIGLTPEDFATVPDEPTAGAETFAPPLGQMLRDRVPPEAHAWVIGHAEHWDRTMAGQLLQRAATPLSSGLEELQTWGAWLHFDDRVHAQAVAQFRDRQTAETLEQTLIKSGRLGQGTVAVESDDWLTWKDQAAAKVMLDSLAKRTTGLPQMANPGELFKNRREGR